MPRLSVPDCEALLRALEERPVPNSHALRAAARLRQRLEQAMASKATSDPNPKRSLASHAPDHGTLALCTLHVCTSCRSSGTPREPRESRPGFILYQELREAFDESPLRHRVDVRPAECLSVCPRPCGIALSSPGAWAYLFGDQHPGESACDIVECITRYVETLDGFMPREERPKHLRASILGRVPPSQRESSCI